MLSLSLKNVHLREEYPAMPYVILFFSWLTFYASHTYLAKLTTKRKIKAVMGGGYRWYRLLYSLLSVVFLFALLLYAGSIPPTDLLERTGVTTYVSYSLTAFGTIICVKAMKGMYIARFIGVSPADDLVDHEALHVDGMYRWVRHPLYAGLLLIFVGWFFFLPTWTSVVQLLALISYLPFGIYFEEKKLLQIYGSDYQDYQKNVPPLFPTKIP